MKISELIKIEPFEIIFQEVVRVFLMQKLNKAADIRWEDKSIRQVLTPKKNIWICNANINAVYRKDIPDKTKK